MKLSGAKPPPRKPRTQTTHGTKVKMVDITTREAALKHPGAEVVDSTCDSCGANHTVRKGPKEIFLGCRNYKTCGAQPIFAWKGRPIIKSQADGSTLVGREVVFYRDEFGEPCGPPEE